MDKLYKKQVALVAFGVILFVALNNLRYIAGFMGICIKLLTPVLSGLLLSFVLSVPMRAIARRLRHILPKATDKQTDIISLMLTLICVAAIIAILCVIAIPQLAASVKSIVALGQEKLPGWLILMQ